MPSPRLERLALAATLLAALAACGGDSGSSGDGGSSIGAAGPNVQPIVVEPGPAGDYVNGSFTSVTVCVPGTTSCQTIDGVLVDTGSSGLRILSSALTLPLPPQSSGGPPLVECNQFQDSYQWGPVLVADVKIADEQASSLPIHGVGGSPFPVPRACADSGLPAQDTLEGLGATGILGVGPFREDCGPACTRSGSSNPGIYFACGASGCAAAAVGLDQQVQNPVAHFQGDNNGVIVQLPAVPATGAPRVSGSLIFGIGTRSNNSLGSARVYTVDASGYFTTVFQAQSYPKSFVDSGSNGLYFLDSAAAGLPSCPESDDFYCPPAMVSLSATNRGLNGTSASVDFQVANAAALFRSPNYVFSDLGGTNPGAFDWGLPFFFGRNVYTAIEQQSTPGGTGPYFAY